MAKNVVEVTVKLADLPEVKALIARAWADGYGLGRDDEADALPLRPNPLVEEDGSPK